jgi:chromatin remodeling complex protein RSC6
MSTFRKEASAVRCAESRVGGAFTEVSAELKNLFGSCTATLRNAIDKYYKYLSDRGGYLSRSGGGKLRQAGNGAENFVQNLTMSQARDTVKCSAGTWVTLAREYPVITGITAIPFAS